MISFSFNNYHKCVSIAFIEGVSYQHAIYMLFLAYKIQTIVTTGIVSIRKTQSKLRVISYYKLYTVPMGSKLSEMLLTDCLS